MSDRTEAGTVSCKGAKTREWYAWNNLMPPRPFQFHIIGEVQVPNPGVEALLVPREPQGTNPRHILLDLILIQKPGIWPQVLTWVQARYDKVLRGKGYEQAQVFCGDETIADIEVENVS